MHDTHYLSTVLILLAAAVCVVPLVRRLRLSPVLGYLAAGAAIGPYGIGVVKEVESVAGIAELGVIFLLFLIGLELSFERLRDMKRYLAGLGSAQFLVTGLVIGLVAVAFEGVTPEAAVIIGGGLALSSTAVVLQLLGEQKRQATKVGRLSTSILIAQDLAVVPLLVLVPLLGRPDETNLLAALGMAGLRTLLTVVVIVVVGHWLLRPLFRAMTQADSPEIFSAATLLIVLGSAWVTEQMGLSPALGAFLAGLLVAETEYYHQVEADIMPYKGLFMGLFFLAVGMGLNLSLIVQDAPLILLLLLGLHAVKACALYGLCRVFGIQKPESAHTALFLSQGGEFAFILLGLAAAEGLLANQTVQLLLAVITLSLALTPLLDKLGRRLAESFEAQAEDAPYTPLPTAQEDAPHDHQPIIIGGFDRVGQTVAKLLDAEKMGYLAISIDARRVSECHKKNLPVYYGNIEQPEVWRALGLDEARAVILTVEDMARTERAVQTIRALGSGVPIIARVNDHRQARIIEKAGATLVIPEEFEAALQIGAVLLNQLGTPDGEVTRVLGRFRHDHYALMQE